MAGESHAEAEGLAAGLQVATEPDEGPAAGAVAPSRTFAPASNPWERVAAPDEPTTGEGQRLGAESLDAFFARTPRFAVAFSGGTDSAYLLAAACAAGCDVKAYMVNTAFQPAFELVDARAVIERLAACGLDVPFEAIDADVLAQTDVCANPPDRCRVCKRFIFERIWRAARADGFAVLVDGTNASDDPARRPGFLSLAEAGVTSPLRRAGLTKADVRAASRALAQQAGLTVDAFLADKPRFACLAVHVPQGELITQAALDRAAQACGL